MTDPEPARDVTQLLAAARGGDPGALDRLFELVYHELRHLARAQLGAGGETLRATALVHEAYLKIVQGQGATPQDRSHFFAIAARAMRQILVDHSRRRQAQKRGAGVSPEVLDEGKIGAGARQEEILAVDAALTHLERLDARLARLVELRFYAGLSVEETAGALAVSERTVKREWRRARAFLYRELHAAPAGGA
ncbi:MAG: sigma-70 family RNA polymerase sigma factor [Acidobacteria bacterium]|nr:sigma-70 family RNA polymerase sigma factor [Acidobacteriota bacterium]